MSPQSNAVALAIVARRYTEVTIDATRLVRVTSHQNGEPYWSCARNNRFDCPNSGTQYGVNYSAPTLSAAFAESVLHDDRHFDQSRARWVVSDIGILSSRWVVNLQRVLRPTLLLFPLFGDFLTSMNIKNSISSGDDYSLTQEMSQVIYENAPNIDGVAYVSNRANRSIAVALFERSGTSVQQMPNNYTPLNSHPNFGAVISQFGLDII